MVFVIHPGSEIDAVGVGVGAVVTRHEGPKAVDLDGLAVSPLQLAKVVIGLKVEHRNGAVAEIPDQEVISELTEAVRRDRESPRRIKVGMGRDSIQQLSVHAELIDIAVARSRHIVMLVCILFGKRNEYIATQNLDAEGRISLLDVWIGEAIHLMKGAIEHVNHTIAEICRVKEGSISIRTDRETLVDRAVMRMINGKNGAAAVHSGVPTRNSAVLGREDKTSGPA